MTDIFSFAVMMKNIWKKSVRGKLDERINDILEKM